MDPQADSSAVLASILARALELRDDGCAEWLELACAECPELTEQVREAARGTELLPTYFADSARTDSTPSQTIGGRFRLDRRIGSGAMGVVYLAEDLELVRTVAVKILRAGLMDPEESRHRFTREAAAMASVQHPAVVTIHDRGHTPAGEQFIVMEWIEGTTLTEIVEVAASRSETEASDDARWIRTRLGVEVRDESSYVRTVARWTAELAAGLEVVHAAGVLHRDIKPSNVLVRKNGSPVLLDFGIALLEGDSTLTRGVTSVGTPSYMPPEALVRGRHRSPASDVYSLTATLYHLLTLRPPYQGTPSEVLAAIATREPVPAARLRPGLPRDLQAILEKGMHRKPRARYTSAAALSADLLAFLEHRPVVARPVSTLTRATRRLMRSKLARGAALALGLVLLAGVAFQVQRMRAAGLQARAFELERHFPPSFTAVGLSNRVYRYESDRAQVQALLDEAAELGANRVRVHLLRASFRLDHADPAGAARDMAVVARELGSAYARELSGRYAALGPEARSSTAVDLAGLPEPVSPQDKYLAAYHAWRSANEARTFEITSAPEVREIPHAEEMRLACMPLKGLSIDARHQRALEAYTDVIRLEARIGGRTATTAHLAGRMLDVMGRYDEALELLREGIELADRAYTIRINAGWAALGLGLYDEARAHLELAVDLRPNYRKPLEDLSWVLIDMGEFDAALERIRSGPLDEAPDLALWRLECMARVETHRALAQMRRGEIEASKLSAQRALEHFQAAKRLGALQSGADARILAGLLEGDDAAIFVGLASQLLKDPHHWWQVQGLLQSMPKDLNVEASAAMRSVLEALVQRLTSRNVNAGKPVPTGD